MSGTRRRTDRLVQLAGIPNRFLSIALAEPGEDVDVGAVQHRAQRDEVIERYNADQRCPRDTRAAGGIR